jgi:hypothetical protein
MQEVDDKFCRRGRLFFRDPVPAIRNDHIFDVIGDTPHHRAHHRAECGFATQGQDRHLKLALRKERPVVGRILAYAGASLHLNPRRSGFSHPKAVADLIEATLTPGKSMLKVERTASIWPNESMP